MFKRILLFLLTNILVIATISIVTSLLGLHGYLTAHGIDYRALAIFCAVWGMAGAFISLLMSRWMAKMAMGVQVIDPNRASGQEKELLNLVYGLARKLGLSTMPEVGIYDSPEVNAFATGPTRSRALVAVSSGLLQRMNNDEVAAVLGHEMSHVANGDMVTMTLIQGVINAFAMFLSRILAYAVSMAMSRSENQGPSMGIYYLFTIVFDILFTVLGSLVVAAFSRYREYRADAGGARLVGKDKMIAALQRLGSVMQIQDKVEDERAPALAALKISQKPSWLALFSSHPPLEKRIQRLQGRS